MLNRRRRDTVASVHGGSPTLLPDVLSLPGIKYVAHAMSLDDDRKLFDPEPVRPLARPDDMGAAVHDALRPELQEYWFAGVHGDVYV